MCLWGAGSVWISAIKPAQCSAGLFTHSTSSPEQQQQTAQCSVLAARSARLDDYGSWHQRFGGNIHLTSPLRSEIDSTVSVIPSISRIFDISLSVSFSFFKDYFLLQSQKWQVRARRMMRPPERRNITAWRIKLRVALCLLWGLSFFHAECEWTQGAGKHDLYVWYKNVRVCVVAGSFVKDCFKVCSLGVHLTEQV